MHTGNQMKWCQDLRVKMILLKVKNSNITGKWQYLKKLLKLHYMPWTLMHISCERIMCLCGLSHQVLHAGSPCKRCSSCTATATHPSLTDIGMWVSRQTLCGQGCSPASQLNLDEWPCLCSCCVPMRLHGLPACSIWQLKPHKHMTHSQTTGLSTHVKQATK